MAVMIGIDPHKRSHTAVALDPDEQPVGELRVRSAAGEVERLVQWATPFAERTWAIEVLAGSAICWLSSSSPPVSGWSTCSRSWPPGSGCWPRDRRTRMIPTTPVRWRGRITVVDGTTTSVVALDEFGEPGAPVEDPGVLDALPGTVEEIFDWLAAELAVSELEVIYDDADGHPHGAFGETTIDIELRPTGG